MALVLLARAQELPELAAVDVTYLGHLIDAASTLLEGWCKRTFLTTVYVDEVYDGDGTRALLLRNLPITALTTVTVVESDDTEVDCAGTEFRRDDGIGEIRPRPDCACTYCFFPSGYRNIKVSYTAGLGITADVLPEAIQEACAQTCKWLYVLAAGASGATAGWKLGDAAKTFAIPAVGSSSLPAEVKMLISRYRKFVP